VVWEKGGEELSEMARTRLAPVMREVLSLEGADDGRCRMQVAGAHLRAAGLRRYRMLPAQM